MKFEGMLPNAPLIYVLSSVRWPTIVGMSKYIERLQSELRKTYPLFDPVITQSVEVQVNPEGPQTRFFNSSIWQFSDPDYHWAIIITNDQLVLHTNRYTRFAEFKDKMHHVLTVVGKIVEITHYLTESIRYVDVIYPRTDETLSDYLPDTILGDHLSSVAGKLIDGFSAASYESKYGKCAMRCWLNPAQPFPADIGYLFQLLKYQPSRPNGNFAVLDTDHFSGNDQAKIFEPDQIISRLDNMHTICHAAFEAIAKPHAFTVWKGESK